MELIDREDAKKYVRLEDGGKYIVYLHHQKRRNYKNPEERVQAEVFLRLVLIYSYLVRRIQQFVPVQQVLKSKQRPRIITVSSSAWVGK